MHGEHNDTSDLYMKAMQEELDHEGKPKYKNTQHEKAMKSPIDQDAIRKAGW